MKTCLLYLFDGTIYHWQELLGNTFCSALQKIFECTQNFTAIHSKKERFLAKIC